MGNDGARGVQAIKSARGSVLAQDEATSVIFGMPAEAIRTGAVDQVVGIDEMYPAIEKYLESICRLDAAHRIPMTHPASSGLMPRDNRPREQVAVFSIAEYSFVISAASIQEIRSTDSLGGTIVELDRPVLRKVRHIVERDARSYYVVSGYEHFHFVRQSRPTTVLILRNTAVAVLGGQN